MTKKVVIYNDIGIFNVSKEVVIRLRELGCQAAMKEVLPGELWDKSDPYSICMEDCNFCCLDDLDRSDPLLIQVFHEFGGKLNGNKKFAIVEIPDNMYYEVIKPEGCIEHVAQLHTKWGPEGLLNYEEIIKTIIKQS